MNNTSHRTHLAGWMLVASVCFAGTAAAQVAGASTTVATSATESTKTAMGWSVKKTLLGKNIYNDAGERIGKVADLIISPERNVSYVIVGAGGFIGIGRHDVAIPVAQIQDRAGRLVMPGATKETIKGLPAFNYAYDTTRRDAFLAAADHDIASGRAAMASLEKRAVAATGEAKSKIDLQIAALDSDVKTAEARLGEMKQATAQRWKEFETGVSDAISRLRKSIETSVS